MRVLTTYPIPQSPRWTAATRLVQPNSGPGCRGRWARRTGWQQFALAARLLWMRKDFDVVVTAAARGDCLFAALQTLLPGRRIPHVMTCCLWKQETNPLRYWCKRALLWWVSRSVSKFVVWSTSERQDYPRYFGIEAERFVFLPHHATMSGFATQPRLGDYAFAGGDSARDYETLLAAWRDLPIPLVIASTNPRWRKAAENLENVQVVNVTPHEFRDLMAGARMVVIPMQKGLLRGAGQQTYLNAMQLRKPVVLTEAPGVRDHVAHGETAWIVPAGDPAALRDAVLQVAEGGPRVNRIVDAAERLVAETFTLDHFVDRNLQLAYSLVDPAGLPQQHVAWDSTAT